MKVKWKKMCGTALICSILMETLIYAAPLPGSSASDTNQDGLETILNDGLVMHSSFDENSISGNRVKDQT